MVFEFLQELQPYEAIYCLSCSSGKLLETYKCVLTCSPGFYQSSTTECSRCSSPCSECTQTDSKCTSCLTSYQYSANTNQCIPNCNSNQIKVTSPTLACLDCHPTCATCSGTQETDCKSCSLSGNLYFDQSTKSCITPCPAGQFGNSSNPICEACNSECLTCIGSHNYECLSCQPPYYFFQGRCLSKCPNGYQNNANYTCDECPYFSPQCLQSCDSTCQICDSTDQSTCITCCPSRNYISGICKCKDSEDKRMTFYECSYLNQAVLDVVLSNSTPTIAINFGKVLSPVGSYPASTDSYQICAFILDTASLDLIGSTSTCKISSTFIIITLDNTAQVYSGDILTFLPNVLTFASNPSGTMINTFFNNIVVQQPPVSPDVEFATCKKCDSCEKFEITFIKMTGDSQRGFKTITWSLLNFDSSDSVDSAIKQVIDSANSQKSVNFTLPTGIIPLEITKSIKVDYLLKNSFQDSQIFTFTIINLSSFSLSIVDTKTSPMYRFNPFDVLLNYFMKSCDMYGIPTTYIDRSVDISASVVQIPSMSFTSTNNTDSFFLFSFSEYSFLSSTTYDVNIHLEQTMNTTLFMDKVMSFLVKSSPLVVQINGENAQFDYRKQAIITSFLRDRDIQSSTADQLIALSWSCINPATSGHCLDKNGALFSLSSGSQITIEKRTFNPYTPIQLTLTGSKDSRSTSSMINVFFSEFGVPVVTASFSQIDPFSQTINLDEEVFVTLGYDSSVNTDILSYSGTVTYDDETIGIISFDYVQLRFRLWDIYSHFDQSILPLEIRFSIYNPNFFMPSIIIKQFTINFPPQNCQFSYTASSSSLIALTTSFTFLMDNCQDDNSPISYKFVFYNSQTELDQEILIPQVIKRKQITDFQASNSIKTVLPSGNLIILGMASDSKQAVYNKTISISVTDVSLTESNYSHLIDQFLKRDGKPLGQYISQLSILAQDLSQKTQFTSSSINNQKITLISTLKSAALNLPLSSQFSTVIDKAINSIIASKIQYSQTDQSSNLKSMLNSLASQLPSSFSAVQTDIRKQQLTDYFETTNSLSSNSNLNSTSELSQLQLNITQTIADLLNSNSLPNEGQFDLQGDTISLKTQKFTDKNICGYYRCTQDKFFDLSNQLASSQPKIYSVSLQSFQTNPFYQDASFQSYTDTLKQYTNDSLVSFPIIIPVIETAGVQPNVSKQLTIEYGQSKNLTSTIQNKINNLTCISKKSNNWSTSNCIQVYDSKQNIFSCLCKEPQPTTIVDDLEQLIINKKLMTAFSGQGISNISNWTNFYAYVAFWLLLSKTVGFIALLIKGRVLDLLDKSRLETMSLSLEKVVPLQIVPTNAATIKQSKPRKVKMSASLKKILEITDKNKDNEIMSSPLTVVSLTRDTEMGNQEANILGTRQKIDKVSEVSMQAKEESKNTNDFLEENDKNSDGKPQISKFTKDNQDSQNQDPSEQEQYQKTQQLAQFKRLSKVKQVLFFHNFFNIFLLPDSKLSRSYRFAAFYVRMIHSLAVGIVYSSQYTQVQMIILGIVNGIVITVVLKLMEILSHLKRIGKILSSTFLMVMLFFYYYLILSIVSGQEYGESNTAMVSYLILFLSDLLFVAVLVSILLRFLAVYTLKYWGKIKYWKQIFDFLNLYIILNTIMRSQSP